MSARDFKVPPGAASERLDAYLAARTGASRSSVLKLIKLGLVQVDGQTARGSQSVPEGSVIRINVAPDAAPRPELSLPVVYRDDDVIVINKPVGIAVHGGNGHDDEPTVVDFARRLTTDPDPDRPGIVHRLDRDTSGLLVIARSAEAKAQLQAQWRTRSVAKTYLTLVVGHLDAPEAVIDLPLDRDPGRPTRRKVMPGGRRALTRYSVLESFDGFDYVSVHPETGRTHQIRVHMAATGHAVAGDTVYGPRKRPLGLSRQFLHASALSLELPSGGRLDLSCPLPPDLEAILKRLRS